ncbi:hypothetical protein EON65_57005 [archaeon]|nr:MAG: hypothetical protein EON65_57005 [archaeon]
MEEKAPQLCFDAHWTSRVYFCLAGQWKKKYLLTTISIQIMESVAIRVIDRNDAMIVFNADITTEVAKSEIRTTFSLQGGTLKDGRGVAVVGDVPLSSITGPIAFEHGNPIPLQGILTARANIQYGTKVIRKLIFPFFFLTWCRYELQCRAITHTS